MTLRGKSIAALLFALAANPAPAIAATPALEASLFANPLGIVFVVLLSGFMIWIVARGIWSKRRTADADTVGVPGAKPSGSFHERLAERLAELANESPSSQAADEPRPSFGRRSAVLGAVPVTSTDGIPESMASIPIVQRLFPEVAARAARPGHQAPGEAEVSPDGNVELASFTLLLGDERAFDWGPVDQAFATFDPDGRWERVTRPSGLGCIMGRGAILIGWLPMPVEMSRLAGMLKRSSWYRGDLDRLSRHSHQLTFTIKSPDDFESKRTVALAATMMLGLLARAPHVVALVNDRVDTIFDSATLDKLVPILGDGEIPIALWTWTAPDSLRDGDVSLSTGGLEPFLGYEIETWHAPHPLAYVKQQFSDVIRYLLIEGPVLGHGDTIGLSADDQSIHCYFGDSQAQREQPIAALFLEFADIGEVTPRPDPIPEPGTDDAPRPVFGRKRI